MRKLTVLLVLALFLASMVPAAFAEDTSDDVSGEGTAEDAEDTPLPERAREKVREVKAKAADARENVAANRERLAAAKDALLEKHQDRVQVLVDKCKETGKTEEECKAMFEKRIANIAALAPKFREKLQEFEERRAERAKEMKELKEDTILGKIARARDFRARAVEQGKIKRAQENYEFAKNKFNEAKAGLEKARERLENAKAARICKDDPESGECENERKELRGASKEKLAKQAEIIINNLEKAKEKAEASEYLTEDEAAKVVEFLEEQKTKFEAIKAEIEAATTKEEIIAAAKKLSDAWKEVKHKVNAYINFIANARMAGVVVKAEHLSAKLERVLERMAENGKDTSAVEPLVAEFKAELDVSKEKFKAAHSLMLEVRTEETEENAVKVQDAQALLKEAKDALQNANKLLRDIFLKLKEAGALQELAEATAAEDVELEDELEEAEETA
ncbi:MAG: hypothetical protein KJ955_00705 [Nanoarchaeota archaeon]|nr:hypothetical protein [Nanoarchaeota archaeon]